MDSEELAFKLSIKDLADQDARVGRPSFSTTKSVSGTDAKLRSRRVKIRASVAHNTRPADTVKGRG